jgi:hypothetical protein
MSTLEPTHDPNARRDEIAQDTPANRTEPMERRAETMELRNEPTDRRHGESLAGRGAYGGPPPNMRDMQRLDMLGAGLAVLITLGPLLMGVITA